MKITVLGSGTSSGIPVIGCQCSVCTSNNPKNTRLRASIYIDLGEEYDNDLRYILVDVGPDFRQQALKHKLPRIDAVLITHAHADHIFGLDDIRMFNFRQKSSISLYAEHETSRSLLRIFSYCFEQDPTYEGGGIPDLQIKEIVANKEFNLGDTKVMPLRIYHGKTPILGFKINSFAYLTDCSLVPEETTRELFNLDCVIVSGLRHREHKTHFTIEKATQFLTKIQPKKGLLTHLAHDIDHEPENDLLLKNSDNKISLAYDSMQIETS